MQGYGLSRYNQVILVAKQTEH